jgi:hypothetical protein
VLNKGAKQWLEAAQTRFVKPLLGYIKLDRQRNVDIREKLKVQSPAEVTETFRKNWKKPIGRIQDERLAEFAFKYRPVGKQKTGGPQKEALTPAFGRGLKNTDLMSITVTSSRRIRRYYKVFLDTAGSFVRSIVCREVSRGTE